MPAARLDLERWVLAEGLAAFALAGSVVAVLGLAGVAAGITLGPIVMTRK